MNREETLALCAQGRDAWNAWATKMLAEKAELEKAGTWAEKDYLKPDNEQTRDWFDAARADFSSLEDKHKFAAEGSDFGDWCFPGAAEFDGATFAGDATFWGAVFSANAGFQGATFSGEAWFEEVTFSGDTRFREATFAGAARFGEARFSGEAGFWGATFSGEARFEAAVFSGAAWFEGATFSDEAWFAGAVFSSFNLFRRAMFSGDAMFTEAGFSGQTSFGGATFAGEAGFWGATFSDFASFGGATFAKDAFFTSVQFRGKSQFGGATFVGPADFSRAAFHADADFSSVKSNVGFALAGATFARVPDLLQTELHREPRLDNVRVRRTWFGPQLDWRPWVMEQNKNKPRHVIRRLQLPFTIDRNVPARFRELKGYAIDGEDSVRELEFHAQEIRTSRFVSDWPWQPRFWFGYLYSTFSDFGRSLIRPLILWFAILIASAAIYLGGNSTVDAARQNLQPMGWWSTLTSYAQSSLDAWRSGSPCETRVPALADDIRASTNAPAEALRLAFSNAFVLFDTAGGDAGRRMYGCLYGLEPNGGGAVPIAPGFVSDWSKVQRMLSAVCIFLFGLALRNMLKLK